MKSKPSWLDVLREKCRDLDLIEEMRFEHYLPEFEEFRKGLDEQEAATRNAIHELLQNFIEAHKAAVAMKEQDQQSGTE